MTERLVMALRGDESEPVVVESDGDSLILTLDDGERLIFVRDEVLEALAPDPVSRFMRGLAR